MGEDSFATQTDGKYVARKLYQSTAILFVVLSAFSCLGFLVAWQTFLFFEGIVVIACVFSAVSGKRNQTSYQLKFEKDFLQIINCATGDTYQVYDIPASDFIISQTKSEQKTNHCSLAIKNTVFAFGGVEKCRELKSYISRNYP